MYLHFGSHMSFLLILAVNTGFYIQTGESEYKNLPVSEYKGINIKFFPKTYFFHDFYFAVCYKMFGLSVFTYFAMD